MSYDSDDHELHPTLCDGYEVLDKYDNTDPSLGDQKVIENLSAFGADLSRERHVVHYLYFVDDASRSSAKAKLGEGGYKTRHGVEYPPSERPKSLIAERMGLVNDEVLADERVVLTAIAEAVNGEYDGWEAALD